MSFNSLPFLVFITVFFLIWPFLKKRRNPKYLFLVISSFVFYGWWDWRFLFLIIFSGLVDYVAALLIDKKRSKARLFLILSIAVNIGSLSVFKYSVFLSKQLEAFLLLFDIEVQISENLPAFTYILPVGISFYTFQSMSYTIDVYGSRLKPTKNILHFFSYLVMFPQLVAGPIVRAKDFLGQLEKFRTVSGLQFWNGIKLILIGYFQKTVLADNIGVFVDEAFAGVNNGVGFYWWIVIIGFAFQIYFDFSGYSQIARGLAKLMGYHFRMNFNHPYLAISLRDFWNRWHISLSTWFRDYVYIPLGGSKKGRFRSHLNMWITMLLSGLWHGASLNFIFWGAFHALALSIERILNKISIPVNLKKANPFSWAITMIQVLIGWVFFRATSVSQIGHILQNMFTLNIDLSFVQLYKDAAIFIGLAIIFEGGYFFIKQVQLNRIKHFWYLEIVFYALLLTGIIFFRGPEMEFIYFQF